MQTIVTLTINPTIDVSVTVEHVVPDDKLRCSQPSCEPGGGGLNVARAIGRMRGEAIALYTSGGPTGQRLQMLLNQEGVKQRPVSISGLTRENFMIFEAASDRQFRFIMPGPELREGECRACLEELRALQPKPDYVVGSGSLPPGVPSDFYAQAARVADELGARFVVDTSGEPLRRAVDQGFYLLKCNMRELRQIVGHEVPDESSLEEETRRLIENERCRAAVVSLGAGGAAYAAREKGGVVWEHLRSPTVPIRSKVGAGDSMVAGLVMALSKGEPVRSAMMFGIAAGSAAVMTPGTELCRGEDVQSLYATMVRQQKPEQ